MPEWLTIVVQALLVAAVSFVAIAALASHVRYQMLAHRSREVSEPGPAAKSAFELRISQWLGTAHRAPPAFRGHPHDAGGLAAVVRIARRGGRR